MSKIEVRFVEVRAVDGQERVINGTLAPYGSDAVIGGAFVERINAGAFRWSDVSLNVQHDRGRLIARTGAGLTLTDSPRALTLRAELPPTRVATDAIEAVRAGLLRGFSVEMNVEADRWEDGDLPVRTIERAVLHGAALVDRPAYCDAEIAQRAMERYAVAPSSLWRWL